MTVVVSVQQRIRKLGEEGVSDRQIATRLGVSCNTVAKYLDREDYSPKPVVVRSRSLVEPYAPIVIEWLKADAKMPRKQRHTAKRVWQRLVEEEGFTGSYDSVARWIKRYRLEHRRPGEGFSELAWSPGVAQVDYRQAVAMIDGQRIVTHERVYDTHTDTVINPVRIVPGLIRRPTVLRQSLIRPYMPQSLLDYLDHADLAGQRRIWPIIDRACKEADFTTMSSIITGMLEADKNIDEANVVMAVKAGSQRPTLTTIVDLSAYDQIMKKQA